MGEPDPSSPEGPAGRGSFGRPFGAWGNDRPACPGLTPRAVQSSPFQGEGGDKPLPYIRRLESTAPDKERSRSPESPPPDLPPFRVEEIRPRGGSTLPHFLSIQYGIYLVGSFEYSSHRWAETALNELRQRIPLDRRFVFMHSIGKAEA
jgi:hypothetical protein